LLLPDLGFPEAALLKTAALFWDSIDLPLTAHHVARPPPEEMLELVAALAEASIVRPYEAPEPKRVLTEAFAYEAAAVARAWTRAPQDATPHTVELAIGEEIFRARARRVAISHLARVRASSQLAEDQGLAPIDGGAFGFLTAVLPDELPGMPKAGAALIQIVVRGAVLDASTPVEEVLRFREKHVALAGRLRGSLIDLAAAIDAAKLPTAVLRQAEAVVSNRVEPALADLETELNRGGLSFVWRELLGVSGIAAEGAIPSGGMLGTARALGRGIHYAFDRDALIRQHPFGYLHRIRTGFSLADQQVSTSWGKPVVNPVQELIELFENMYSAAYRADPRHEWALSVVGPRATDAEEAARVLFELSAEVIGAMPSPWWEGLGAARDLPATPNQELTRRT
jgi:hypothetical protein